MGALGEFVKKGGVGVGQGGEQPAEADITPAVVGSGFEVGFGAGFGLGVDPELAERSAGGGLGQGLGGVGAVEDVVSREVDEPTGEGE